MSRIEVVDDPAAVVAAMLCEAAEAGEHIVLTGGSTPKRAYELAAATNTDWSSSVVWFGDERCVPPDDERSNYGMAATALLDRMRGGRRPLVMRMEGERGPQGGAEAYEALLMEHLGGEPRFDLLLLGLGPDGHTASLFPGKPAVDEDARLAVGVPEAGLEPYVPRITLTLPAINAARRVVFLVAGADKAAAVGRAFGGVEDRRIPSSLVHEPLVILDAAAAGELPR